MHRNKDLDFIFATLDGELTEKSTGRRGILEIKTTQIQNSIQWEQWDGKIPGNYFVQALHQMLATGWDFVILKAQIKYSGKDKFPKITVRHFIIERSETADSIQHLLEKEMEFWEYVKSKKEPHLVLPPI
jgi:predicted phage-related endonuclease